MDDREDKEDKELVEEIGILEREDQAYEKVQESEEEITDDIYSLEDAEEDTFSRLDEDTSEDTGDMVLEDEKEQEVVGVRFRTAGKSYYFAVGDLEVERGTHVIVETSRGMEYGTCVCKPFHLDKSQFKEPVKKIIRIASKEDDERLAENTQKEKQAYEVCLEKIKLRGLDMKLIDAEYTFDGNKILFYFTSDGRVDFRDLVRDLASVFHTRIELRQIGVRDETKILGGYGICGRQLCCHTYLSDFVPVSIRMAKDQNLSLNPAKISGSCGRLMCCLKNEEETYQELNQNLPSIGDEVQGSDGLTGEVVNVDILKQIVRILVEVDDEKELHEYRADEIQIIRKRKRGQAKPKINRIELKSVEKSKGLRQSEKKENSTINPSQIQEEDPDQRETEPEQDWEQKSNPTLKQEGEQDSKGRRSRRKKKEGQPLKADEATSRKESDSSWDKEKETKKHVSPRSGKQTGTTGKEKRNRKKQETTNEEAPSKEGSKEEHKTRRSSSRRRRTRRRGTGNGKNNGQNGEDKSTKTE